jgi:hypothetical protein
MVSALCGPLMWACAVSLSPYQSVTSNATILQAATPSYVQYASAPAVHSVEYPNVMVTAATFSAQNCTLYFELIGGDVPPLPANGTIVVLENVLCMPTAIISDNAPIHFVRGVQPGQLVVSALSPLFNVSTSYEVYMPRACVPACSL